MQRTLTRAELKSVGTRCANCGSTNDLQYHHIVPLSMGGNDIATNIVCLCGECHTKIHYGTDGRIRHNDAVKVGIKAAQGRGVKFGRKPIDMEPIIRIIAENSTQFNPLSWMTESEVRELAGVKQTTYYKAKQMLIQQMRSGKWPYAWKKPEMCMEHAEYTHLILAARGDKPKEGTPWERRSD